jgi:hypothetical protein
MLKYKFTYTLRNKIFMKITNKITGKSPNIVILKNVNKTANIVKISPKYPSLSLAFYFFQRG